MEKILGQLRKIVNKEEKMGLTNAAVFGGFANYFISALEQILPQISEPVIKEQLSEMQLLARRYQEETLAERAGTLKKMTLLLERINPQYLPRLSPEKPIVAQTSALVTPVRYLKNVGPKRDALFHKIGVKTVEDLLEFYPWRYEDRRMLKKINRLLPGQVETVQGRIAQWEEFKPRPRLSILKIRLTDETGAVWAVWFNQQYLKKQLKPGSEILVHGKVERKFSETEIMVQDYEVLVGEDALAGSRIVPVYRTTGNLPQKAIRKIIFTAVEKYAAYVTECLPLSLREKYGLMEKKHALQAMHFPNSPEEQRAARNRLAFEELLLLQLGILAGASGTEEKGIKHIKDESVWNKFKEILPFPLTAAQERVIGEIYRDMESDRPMARLVQGDVGSGKTVVAAAALYKAVLSGFQGAMMAPTEILAEQHFQSLSSLLGNQGVKVDLLTGRTSTKERGRILADLRDGKTGVLVGTHALIQDQILFQKLSLAVTDEQHRFGVRQRAALQSKGLSPDVLVMTATPIPRTLALTLYGDLNLSLIDEMPPGRKEVKTYAVKYNLEKRVFAFIEKELCQGRQAYVVCPLVEESEKIDLQAATELAEQLEQIFSNFTVALLHGKMKSEEKEKVMAGFRSGEIQLLVSTTVIEVGINIPNATVMLIRDAERFGLAQLHQLRGRIGRGSFQSYCILMHNAKTKEARERMNIMESTHDGFKIAEADLTLRGPGDFFGTRQHGLPELKVAGIIDDAALLESARQEALAILEKDPKLILAEHREIRRLVQEKFKVIN